MDNPDAMRTTKTIKRILHEMVLEKGVDALVALYADYLVKDKSLSFTEHCVHLVIFCELVSEIEQEINN